MSRGYSFPLSVRVTFPLHIIPTENLTAKLKQCKSCRYLSDNRVLDAERTPLVFHVG